MAKGKKLAVNVALHDDSGKLHDLRIGDTVPDWAKDRIGDHCFEEDEALLVGGGSEELNPEGENDLNGAANIDILGDPDRAPVGGTANADPTKAFDEKSDTEGEGTPDAKAAAKGEGTPDFTKPSTRARGKNAQK